MSGGDRLVKAALQTIIVRGLAISATHGDARKMSRIRKKYFSESVAPKFVGSLRPSCLNTPKPDPLPPVTRSQDSCKSCENHSSVHLLQLTFKVLLLPFVGFAAELLRVITPFGPL